MECAERGFYLNMRTTIRHAVQIGSMQGRNTRNVARQVKPGDSYGFKSYGLDRLSDHFTRSKVDRKFYQVAKDASNRRDLFLVRPI